MTVDTVALGERAQAMIDALATISAVEGQLTRLYLTAEHKRAAELVGAWMRRAGLTVRMDAAGTMHGLLAAGRDGPRAKKRLLVGSHIDTVVDAGRYDGNFGVAAAIIAADELQTRGIALPFALEVLAFGDEEGVRFPKTLISSSAIAGAVDPTVMELVDAEGMTMRAALAEFGGDPDHIEAEAYRRPTCSAISRCISSRARCWNRRANRWASSRRSPGRGATGCRCAARPAMPAPCR